MNSNRTILVTGGAGYIGSHTCKLLFQSGYFPVVLDNLVYGHRSFVKWGPLIEGDISDRVLLNKVFLEYSPNAVIHFAAYAYVGESVQEPSKYYRNNVCGTLNLLEAMRNHQCRRLIFSSTCATYGAPQSLPIREDHPQQPINPYGWSKLMVEQIMSDYDKAYDIKSITLRYFNAAGADPESEIGEDHSPETHLIPLTMESILREDRILEVFGTDYPTPDGTAVRDYIHVHDLAKAHLLSFEKLEADKRSDCFNLGTGNGLSVKQIVDSTRKITNREVKVRYGDRRAGDPHELVADPGKAGMELGWKADHSDIETIISSAWKWHRKNSGDETS